MRYNAIVIGGGHNGLTAAACLARAGRTAVVLERRHTVGGAAVTEEVALAGRQPIESPRHEIINAGSLLT